MIAEPSSDLWTAIKQKYNAWPPDNEDVANQLGTHLGTFASAASAGHSDLHQTGQSLGAVWRDSAGADMVDKVSSVASDWSKIAQTAGTQGALAQSYSRALSFVKQTISGTVAANEPLYELLSASSLLHPLRTRLVNHLASAFQSLVGDGTATEQSSSPFSFLRPVTSALGGAVNWVRHEWDTKTFGIGLGGGVAAFVFAGGASVNLVHTPQGWGVTESLSKEVGVNTGAGAWGGLQFTYSDGQSVDDQKKWFDLYEAGGGDGLGAGGAYADGSNDAGQEIQDYSGWLGLTTPGVGGNMGRSYTWVQHIR
ncbi:WXG100-like domain-containing protein [Kutzneria sp. CA-103260]|uniref:WXG100-like domain-containing protein n=1 Tax=Kutzneria sp. CA-103260 TaxID=2802641 RepID=UPI001BAD30F4|nr:hypothetical protein [Kutzneria sp. CA-103260]QUQ67168.1 hypothetical protein JJ691_49010 [Kutzneria sp. CA-103260]